MACNFCATGSMEFKNSLSSGEIVEQLVHTSSLSPIRNVVFMVGIIHAITKHQSDLPNLSLAVSLHAPVQEICYQRMDNYTQDWRRLNGIEKIILGELFMYLALTTISLRSSLLPYLVAMEKLLILVFVLIHVPAFTLPLWNSLMNEHANGCYTSIFGFGDSIIDTGNLLLEAPPNEIPHVGFPPYGETYFHHPTAEYFGLPLVPPSAAAKKRNRTTSFAGVNFAVTGAPALDLDFYAKRGIYDPITNDSLRIQLNQFKAFLPSICDTSLSESKNASFSSFFCLFFLFLHF